MGRFQEIAQEIGKLVEEKNAAYGNSYIVTAEALKLYYPEGIEPSQYTDALLIVRISDKIARIANRKDAFGESPYRDIAGYGICGVVKDEGPGEPLGVPVRTIPPDANLEWFWEGAKGEAGIVEEGLPI